MVGQIFNSRVKLSCSSSRSGEPRSFSKSVLNFLTELQSRRLCGVSADARQGHFCFGGVRRDSVLLHDNFVDHDPDDPVAYTY